MKTRKEKYIKFMGLKIKSNLLLGQYPEIAKIAGIHSNTVCKTIRGERNNEETKLLIRSVILSHFSEAIVIEKK